jgi:hypothetical protein
MTDTPTPGAGKAEGPSATLSGVNIESGTNTEGKPFCHVIATAANGWTMQGQLDPDEVRAMALAWLAAAEAAEQDGAVLRTCLRLELPVHLAAAVVGELRKTRGRVVPWP